jgi:type III secretory pathway component EscT
VRGRIARTVPRVKRGGPTATLSVVRRACEPPRAFPMIPKGLLDAIFAEVSAGGQSLSAWGVAWARALPTAVFVAVFGLAMLPLALRLAVGFVLAVSIAPLLHPPVVAAPKSWLVVVVSEFARGVPVAAAASVSLWAAVVAGGVADHVTRAGRGRVGRIALSDGSPFATLLSLAAAVSFLQLGGAERIAARLAAPDLAVTEPLARAVRDLAAGVELGVGIGAPLLLVALVLDLATLVVVRELRPLRTESTLAPLRSLVLFVATAALLDRMAEAVATQTIR